MPTKKTEKAPSKSETKRAASAKAKKGTDAKPAKTPRRRSKATGRDLVIVESPAKARTLAGMLGPKFEITASVGHVRDLPKSKLGVDIEQEFEPQYVVPREKREVVEKIKNAAADAEKIYLATDPDREGEAISWHVVEAAGLEGRNLERVVFHELTPTAIEEAFANPRSIDLALVDAQQARRVLDRLVGYKISPLLWKKVRRGLSAGRVQSVALRMVVDREREVLDFKAKEYWTIDADLAEGKAAAEASFPARLRGIAGERDFEIGTSEESERISEQLRGAVYTVKSVQRKDQSRRPSPPFTTSTLQQEASRRFGYTAKRTMALAQQLYEGIELDDAGRVGLITYMRTDSVNLAEIAVSEIRSFIENKYGKEFLPASPRTYKARKGAQEAHEAIRPTSVDRDPGSAELSGLSTDLRRLYTLIWQRTVSCQMTDAVLDRVTVDVEAKADDVVYALRATTSSLRFAGYRQLYEEAKDRPESEEEQVATVSLPDLTAGDRLTLEGLKPEQHFTEPPPRFTEATLVKALEENGIGRPSTYAPIMSTIQDRGYVERQNKQLKPTELGFVVNDFMVDQFPNVIDLGFTAGMEEELDEIASGQRPWQPTVRELYNPLSEALVTAEEAPPVVQETGELCPECEKPLIRRFGRFGPFFACSGFPECRYTRPDADVEPEASDEKCDVCGSAMVSKRGRFGAFLACTKYPECKGTKPLLQKTGVPCPTDGGEIVERTTKRGRRFYGCSNYPTCEFTSWQRPLPQVCPTCAGMIVAERGRKAHCTVCDWSGPASEAQERDSDSEPSVTAAVS